MSNNLTIGIIGAMDCEVSELKQKLENLEEIKHGNLQINLGTFYGHKIVLVKSGIGKVNAALCTQYIIDKFNPDYIINTGIAGGIAENLKVGEIVIGEKLVQYDFDVTAFGYAKGYLCTGIESDKPTYFNSDEGLMAKLERISDEKVKIHKGIIASGDSFISDLERKKEIHNLFNATAVEMEGCAIAQTSNANNIPFVVIRAISDLADNNATESYTFSEDEIAKVSSSVVENLLKEI
mgnify:FL=1